MLRNLRNITDTIAMTCPKFFCERQMSRDPIHTLHKCGFPIKREKKSFVRDCAVSYIDIRMNMVIGI